MQLQLPGCCCHRKVHITESAAAGCQQACSLSCFFGPLTIGCHGCIGQLGFTIVWVPAARKADRMSFQLLPQKASGGKEIVSELEEGAETEQPSSNSNYQQSPFYEFYWCWQTMSAEWRRGGGGLNIGACVKSLQSCLTPSLGFSRLEYWSGLPCAPPGDLLHPGIVPASYISCIGRQVLHHEHHLGSPSIPDATSTLLNPVFTI